MPDPILSVLQKRKSRLTGNDCMLSLIIFNIASLYAEDKKSDSSVGNSFKLDHSALER